MSESGETSQVFCWWPPYTEIIAFFRLLWTVLEKEPFSSFPIYFIQRLNCFIFYQNPVKFCRYYTGDLLIQKLSRFSSCYEQFRKRSNFHFFLYISYRGLTLLLFVGIRRNLVGILLMASWYRNYHVFQVAMKSFGKGAIFIFSYIFHIEA